MNFASAGYKMAKKKQTEELTEKLLEPIAKARGVQIYDVEYVKEGQEYFLRAFIDKDGGVTIDDCVDVSHDLSDALDAADPIPEAYTLEVSSPGLGRTLSKDRHFAASIGKAVEGNTFKPYDEAAGGKNKNFDGILKAFDGDTITIARADAKGNALEDLVLERKAVAKIRLKIDF